MKAADGDEKRDIKAFIETETDFKFVHHHGDYFDPGCDALIVQEGIEVSTDTLIPEMTIASCGVYWHPLISPADKDMLVTTKIFPLENAIKCIEQLFYAGDEKTNSKRAEFT